MTSKAAQKEHADQRERVLALAERHRLRVQRAQYVDREGNVDLAGRLPDSWSVISTNPVNGVERVEARNLTLAHLEKKLRNW